MEYLELGDLETYDELAPPQVDAVFYQMGDAVTYLHGLDITHCDLKPANILVKSLFPVHIVVADFGFASQEVLLTMCGSYLYCAPEMFNRLEREAYTSKVNVWSVGIIMMQFATVRPSANIPTTRPWRIERWLKVVDEWKRGASLNGHEHLMEMARSMLVL